MTIDINKKYKTGDGREAQILKIILGSSYPVKVYLPDTDELECYTLDGKIYSPDPTPADDLIEVGPFDSFKVDEPVFVSNDGMTWHKRYFAGIDKHGKPEAFLDGATSWSADGRKCEWLKCRRVEDLKAFLIPVDADPILLMP